MMISTAPLSTVTLGTAIPARLFGLTQAEALPAGQHQDSPTFQNALASYPAASAQKPIGEDGGREKPVLDFTLDGVATSVTDLRDSTRHALDDLAAKVPGIKVERIKIDGYDPVLSMIGDQRANAVMGYLSVKGVDKSLMWPEGHWRKPWDPDFKLADKHCVVIKVYGQPRIDAGMMSV